MTFMETLGDESGEARTRFHQLPVDVQIALEELDSSLMKEGLKLVIVTTESKTLDILIRITN